MDRATRWFLGLPEPLPTDEEQLQALETVQMESSARRQLLQEVGVRGRWHGGPLFGQRRGNALLVPHITRPGPPGQTIHPLSVSLAYLMGASLQVSTLMGDTIDWAGQWLAAPDGRLPDQGDDFRWVTLGGRSGLIDDEHPLVVVGVQDGYLVGRAYLWAEGCALEVECPLGPLSS